MGNVGLGVKKSFDVCVGMCVCYMYFENPFKNEMFILTVCTLIKNLNLTLVTQSRFTPTF